MGAVNARAKTAVLRIAHLERKTTRQEHLRLSVPSCAPTKASAMKISGKLGAGFVAVTIAFESAAHKSEGRRLGEARRANSDGRPGGNGRSE